MLDALRLSVGTLTIVPSGPIAEIDRRTAARAMIIAPLAVLPLAAAVALLGWLARTAGLPSLAVGLLVVGGLALGSRALHLDGLADTVDGFGSGWTAERSLMVMRRGDVGPMGVVALIIVLGLQAVSVGELIQGVPGALLVGAAVCCSRAALCLTCVRGVPAARGDGLGVVSGRFGAPHRSCGLLACGAADHERGRLAVRSQSCQRSAGRSGRRGDCWAPGLSLRTPAGWCHWRRDGRRDRNRVHRHDHRDDAMTSQSQWPAPQRP